MPRPTRLDLPGVRQHVIQRGNDRHYLALSIDPTQRQQAYRAFVMETVDPMEVGAIRQHVQRQHAYRHGPLPRSDGSAIGARGLPTENRQAAKVRVNRERSTLTPVLRSVD